MTSPGRYSAGTAFLDVVPTFRGVQHAIAREVRQMEKALGKQAGEQFGKEFEQNATRAVDRALGTSKDTAARQGKKAAEDYTDAFEHQLRQSMDRAGRSLRGVKIPAEFDDRRAQNQFKALLKQFERLSKVKIGVDMDAGAAYITAARLEDKLRQLRDVSVDIGARTNFGKAIAELEAFRKRVQKDSDFVIEAELKIDQHGLFEKVLRRRIEAALENFPPIEFDANVTPAQNALMRLRQQMQDLRNKRIGVDINGADALAEVERLRQELARLATDESIDVNVRTDAAGAAAELLEIRKLAKLVDDTRVEINVDVDDGAAVSRLERIRRAVQGTGHSGQEGANAFRVFNFAVLAIALLAPAAVPALTALAGGIALTGAAALGAAGGLGVLLFGFMGIKDAVTALGKAQETSARDTTQAARTMRNASRSVEDAERALARARESAGQSAVNATRKVADAVQNQRDAERALVDAQREVVRSQEAVTQARLEAQERLEDLQLSIRGGELAERRALLNLAEARTRYNNALADPGATRTEREELLLSLQEEELNLDRVREQNSDLARERAEADRTGVEGSREVVAAQDRVRQAQEGVQGALRAVAEAAQGVRDAVADQQRSQVDSARAVEDAQRNLAEAQQAYSDALYDTSVQGSAAMQNLETAMGKLSPAGRHFAIFIDGLRGQFREMRDIVQAGVLPGVESMISTILRENGPIIRRFLTDMSQVVGDMFRDFGELMTSPQWKDIWASYAHYAPIFMRQFGQIGMNLLTFFGELFRGLAPYTERFGDALVRMTGAMADWMHEVADSKGFRDFMEWLFIVGAEVFETVWAVFRAIHNIFKALQPLGLVILAMIRAVAEWIADMDPKVLGAIVGAVLGLVVAFQLASGALALLVGGIGILSNPITQIVFIISAVVAGIVVLYTTSETARDIIDAVFNVIGAVVSFVWNFILKPIFWLIGKAFEALGAVISWVWEHIILPVWNFFADVFHDAWRVLKPIFEAVGDAFEWLGDRIAEAWEFIKGLWNDMVEGFSDLIDTMSEGLESIGEQWKGWAKGLFDSWYGEGSGDAAFEAIGASFDALPSNMDEATSVAGTVWDQFTADFNEGWEQDGAPVFDEFTGKLDGLWEKFDQVGEALGAIWKTVSDSLTDTYNGYIAPIFEFFGDLVDRIKERIGIGFDEIGTQWDELMTTLGLGGERGSGTLGRFATKGKTTEDKMVGNFSAIGQAWEDMTNWLGETFEGPMSTLISNFKGAWAGVQKFFGNIMESIQKQFYTLINLLKAPIRFVIEKIINGIFIGGFNNLAKSIGSDARMRPLPVPFAQSGGGGGGFAAGGFTGPGGKYQPAGVVHAGEYVEPMESVDYYGTKVFEAFHKRRVPLEIAQQLAGYASGGYVAMGNIIKKQFPTARITSSYRPGDPGYHGSGQAIDIGGSIPYPNAQGMREMLQINHWIAANFPGITELIHTAAGAINLWHGQRHTYNASTQAAHRNHVHWAMAKDLVKSATSLAGGFLTDPVGFLRDLVTKGLGTFGNKSEFHGILADLPAKFMGMAAGKIEEMLSSAFGFGDASLSGIAATKFPTGSNQAIVQQMAAQRGWTGSQWNALYALIMKESGFRNTAQNPTSTAYGMFQFLNSTWAATGISKTSDPRLQTEAGFRYIASRYGTPAAALAFHRAHNWYDEGGEVKDGNGAAPKADAPTLYDTGGWLPPGVSTVLNATNKPEPILTNQQWEQLTSAGREESYSGPLMTAEFNGVDYDQAQQVYAEFNHGLRVLQNGGKYARERVGAND